MPRFQGIPVEQPNRFGGIPVQTEQQRQQLGAEMTHPAAPISRETRATQDLPEFGQGGLLAGEDRGKVLKLAPLLLLTTNPQEISQIVRANFPHIAQQQDEAGNEILANQRTGQQVVINKPGVSKLDILQTLGVISAYTPAGRAAGMAGTTAGKVALGGGAAGLTETGIQAAQQATGGEFDPGQVAIATGLGAGMEAVGAGVQGLRRARSTIPPGEAGQEAAANIARAQQAERGLMGETGKKVGLFKAQQTLDPAQLIEQRVLPQLSAGSRQAAKALSKQNKEAYDLTVDVLGKIAPESAVETGAVKFRTAAQKAIEARKAIRKEIASPLYEEAFKSAQKPDIKPFLKNLDDRMTDLATGGEIQKSLMKIKRMIGESPSLKKLHNAKIEIDQMMTKTGESSLGNTTKAELVGVKNDLLKVMDESDLYRSARQEFERLSPAVNELTDSIVGRVSKLPDEQLDSIAQKVFMPRNTVKTMNKMKNIIKEADPQAWDDIVRVELERRFGAMKDLAEQTDILQTGNLPGQIKRAVFGNPKQRQLLLSATDGQAKQNLLWLETVLNRAGAGRAAGSPTTPFAEAVEKMRGFWIGLRDWLRPAQKVGGAFEQGMFDRRVSALAEAVYDPNWAPRMKEIRAITEPTKQQKMLTGLLRDIEGSIKATPQILKPEGIETEVRP